MNTHHLHHRVSSFRTDPSVMDMSVLRSTSTASATPKNLDQIPLHPQNPSFWADLSAGILINTTLCFPFSP